MIVTAEQLFLLYMDEMRSQALGNPLYCHEFVAFVENKLVSTTRGRFIGELLCSLANENEERDFYIFLGQYKYHNTTDPLSRIEPGTREFFERMAKEINELADELQG